MRMVPETIGKSIDKTIRQKWRFADLLDEEGVGLRWEKVRRFFFLRESTYDVTNRCNIRCEGCYYMKVAKNNLPRKTPTPMRGVC